jgi:carboxylesterase
MTAPVLAGAEPFSAAGGAEGVLVLHGFTGTPHSMRPLAERLADAGLTVELPLLPGHGTSVDDLVPTRFADWSGAAEAAYQSLAARCRTVAVTGLSMGGTLTCWLAERHPEVVGLALVNPLVAAPDDDFVAALRELLAGGTAVAPGIASDIARPDTVELAYDEAALAAALSLFDGATEVGAALGEIRCPVLLLSSRQDHVVPPSNGDRVVSSVSGPVERVWLERSFHVATMDHDRDEVEERIVRFVTAVTAGVEG